MNKKHTIIFPLLTSLLFISACDSQHNDASLQAESDNKIRPAKLQVVGFNQQDSYLNYPAIVNSSDLNTLSFEVSGVVREINVVEAQKVNKGDILATLDTRDLLAKLNSAQAQYNSSNSDFERAERLIAEDAISKSELEQRRSKRDVDKASLETAQKAMQDANLIAPFTGNIAEIFIKKQQAITSGETAITVLGDGVLEASINLPASIVATAMKEEKENNSSYLIFSFAPNLKVPATFKEAKLNADNTSQTYQISFTFISPENLNILPGMNATLWFKNPNRTDENLPSLKVPLIAVSVDGQKKYVWVVNPESMEVNKRYITLVEGIGEHLIVKSGLTEGETIVVAGVSSMFEGMKVRSWSKE
jgi:RND family efflux transporter MFP subunit|tara:strand:+ start:1362 stop:2447 length:1086 start_codon:yes stop_codon:yes gene_type:complete